MSEQNYGDADISKGQEGEAPNASDNHSEGQDDGESVEEIKARLAKAEELANNYKIRAEKAEKLGKSKPETKEATVNTQIDNATLARIYGIEEEDIDEVMDVAKLRKVSFAEAMKLDLTKTILSNKQEFRKTASIANTGSGKKSSAKISDEALLEKVAKGEIPAKGSEEAERLFWLKRGGKR
jgi:hypothetical protein